MQDETILSFLVYCRRQSGRVDGVVTNFDITVMFEISQIYNLKLIKWGFDNLSSNYLVEHERRSYDIIKFDDGQVFITYENTKD